MYIVEHESGELTQHLEQPGTCGIDPGAQWAELPHEIDLATEKWDFAAAKITSCFTPEAARDRRWQQAKDYREIRLNEPMAVPGVLPDAVIVVNCDGDSRLTILTAFTMATSSKAAGAPYEIEFTDYDNVDRVLDADQTITLGATVAAVKGACHRASQNVRKALDAALAAGATADEILNIDITAGYPTEPVSPPLPPSEPES